MGYIKPDKNLCEIIQEHDDRLDALEVKKGFRSNIATDLIEGILGAYLLCQGIKNIKQAFNHFI